MLRFLLGFLALAAILTPPAIAQTPSDQELERYVTLRLLPERSTIAAGEDIWIGIEQSIAPHWHTYWKNPGDSGAAPKITWDLPDGFEISDISWPAPAKIQVSHLMNYGYENQVILLQKLKAPETLPDGPVTLAADIEVLVCNVECIPEFGTYAVTLNDPAAESENNNAYLETALAKVPVESDWDAHFSEKDGQFVLQVNAPENDLLRSAATDSIALIPQDWGMIKNAAPVSVSLENGVVTVRQERDTRPLSALTSFSGVLLFTVDGAPLAKSFTAKPDGILTSLSGAANPESGAAQTQNGTSLAHALLLAFLGGLILNLMPCVFPVLSIKALSLIKLSDKERTHAQLQGIAYTAGVVLSFVVIAGLLILFKSWGTQIGWGFQLQNPYVVTLLAYLLFVIGLNLSGSFEVPSVLSNFGQNLAGGHSLSGSFFTGVLATLVATPCTAPFMAAAIGYALTQHAVVALSVFASLGFGLAAPYLVLCLVPAAQKLLPRPGAWMDTFKHFLAFPMYASAAWLTWVLSLQTGSDGVFNIAFGFVTITFALWLWQHTPQQRMLRLMLRILALALLAITLASLPQPDSHKLDRLAAIDVGGTFSPTALESALASDAPVFVEMTAAWCITCKVNKAVALDVTSTKDLFARENVVYLIGDWTNQDSEITQYLTRYGRSGVPLYVFYGRPDPNTGKRPEAVVLPQILTPAIVAAAIAGSSN